MANNQNGRNAFPCGVYNSQLIRVQMYTQWPFASSQNGKRCFFFKKKIEHLKFGYLENEECKLSEILNISLFAIFQFKDARLL